MVIKTIIMFALYTVPYILMITDVFHSAWGMFAMYAVMGLGSAGIGLGVMHDANHGSYSSKRWMNYTLGLSLNMVGGHSFLWKLQHNVLHHTYTNIHEADEDITFKGVMRVTPDAEWKPIHIEIRAGSPHCHQTARSSWPGNLRATPAAICCP